jgi:uncharacterized protein (TIGR02466 family)
MIITPIFSTGIAIVDERSSLNLARKIFLDNYHLMIDSGSIKTNIVHQNTRRHIIRDSYINLTEINQLKSIILLHSIEYLKQIGFWISSYEYEVVNLWFNEMQAGHYQSSHNHPGFLVSGTFYINITPNSRPITFISPMIDSIPYYFSDPQREYNQYNSENWSIIPEEGEIILWLSNLKHSVPVSNSNDVRRSISFDINIKC